jgi:hypothetical protein
MSRVNKLLGIGLRILQLGVSIRRVEEVQEWQKARKLVREIYKTCKDGEHRKVDKLLNPGPTRWGSWATAPGLRTQDFGLL